MADVISDELPATGKGGTTDALRVNDRATLEDRPDPNSLKLRGRTKAQKDHFVPSERAAINDAGINAAMGSILEDQAAGRDINKQQAATLATRAAMARRATVHQDNTLNAPAPVDDAALNQIQQDEAQRAAALKAQTVAQEAAAAADNKIEMHGFTNPMNYTFLGAIQALAPQRVGEKRAEAAVADEGLWADTKRMFARPDFGPAEDMHDTFVKEAPQWMEQYGERGTDMLLTAKSSKHLEYLKSRLDAMDENQKAISGGLNPVSGAHQVFRSLAYGLEDPINVGTFAIGALASGGVAPAVEVAGAATKATRAAQIARAAISGAGANVGFVAASQATGAYHTFDDYTHAAMFGAVLGSGGHLISGLTSLRKGIDLSGLKEARVAQAGEVQAAATRLAEDGMQAPEIRNTLENVELSAQERQARQLLAVKREDGMLSFKEEDMRPTYVDPMQAQALEKNVTDLKNKTAVLQGKVAQARIEASKAEPAVTGQREYQVALKDMPVAYQSAVKTAAQLDSLMPGELPDAVQFAKATLEGDAAKLQQFGTTISAEARAAGQSLAAASGDLHMVGATLDDLAKVKEGAVLDSILSMGKARGTTTVQELLRSIEEDPHSPEHQELARRLRSMMNEDVPVMIGDRYARPGMQGPAAYDPALGHVALKGDAADWVHSKKRTLSHERAILHEASHAVTMHQLEEGAAGKLKGPAKVGYDKATALFNEVKQRWAGSDKEQTHALALQGLDEFMSYGLTSRKLVTDLRNMDINGKSALAELRDSMENLSGYKAQVNTKVTGEDGLYLTKLNTVAGARNNTLLDSKVMEAQAALDKHYSDLAAAQLAQRENTVADAATAAFADDPKMQGFMRGVLKQADAALAARPLDPSKTQTVLEQLTGGKVGFDKAIMDVGNTLARSNNKMVQAVAVTVPELTRGSAGRTHATVALTRENIVDKAMDHQGAFKVAFDNWLHERNISGIDMVRQGGKVHEKFYSEVVQSIHEFNANPQGATFKSPAIKEAVQAWKEHMDYHATNLIEARAGGHEGIEVRDDYIYMPQKGDSDAIYAASRESNEFAPAMKAELSRQLQERSGWSEVQADLVADKFVEGHIGKAVHAADFDFNMNQGDRRSDVLELLENSGRTFDEARAMAENAKGAASFTKGRMDLDMLAEFKVGDKSYRLMDLFNKDLGVMGKRYSDRAAGEAAMAAHGMGGRAEFRMMQEVAQRTGATPEELKAMESIGAELFGTAKTGVAGGWLRDLTSAATLGGAGISQAGEVVRIGSQLGLGAMLRAVPGLRSMLTSAERGAVRESGGLESLIDIYGSHGAQERIDTMTPITHRDIPGTASAERASKLEKLARKAAIKVHVYSGENMIRQTELKIVAHEMFERAILRTMKGDFEHLSWRELDTGLTKELVQRLNKDMPNWKIDNPDGTYKIDWSQAKDVEAVRLLNDSVKRGAAQIITGTFIGERANHVGDGTLAMLNQFRGFAYTAMNKHISRTIANAGVVSAIAGMACEAALSLPVVLAKHNIKTLGMDAKQRKKYWESKSLLSLSGDAAQMAPAWGVFGDIYGKSAGLLQGPIAHSSANFSAGGLKLAVKEKSFGGSILDNVAALGYIDRAYKAVEGVKDKGFTGDKKVKAWVRLGKVMPVIGNNPIAGVIMNAAARGE